MWGCVYTYILCFTGKHSLGLIDYVHEMEFCDYCFSQVILLSRCNLAANANYVLLMGFRPNTSYTTCVKQILK